MMPSAATSAVQDRGAGLRRVATAFLRQRPFIVAPMFAALMISLIKGSAPRSQVLAMAAVGACAFSFFTWEAVQGRKRLVTPRQLWGSLAATLLAIACGAFFTGGSASPLLFMAFAPVVVAFAAFGRGKQSNAMLAIACAVLLIVALLPAPAAFPAFALPVRRWLVVICAADALVLLRVGAAALTDAHAAARRAAAGAGEDAVASAAARAEALEAMGAKVAHEVRNPLSAIRGLIEVQAEKATDDSDRRRLSVVMGEVDRINDILSGYLAMARPLERISAQPCDLAQLVRDVATVMEARSEKAGIALDVDVAPAMVVADPRRLKEAVLNLVLNAFEHTQPGGAVVLRVRSDDAGACISVEDNGVGMDEAALSRAGTAFTSGREGGTGLGLALARQAVEQHGGRMSMTSAVGQGTAVAMHLPAQPAEAA